MLCAWRSLLAVPTLARHAAAHGSLGPWGTNDNNDNNSYKYNNNNSYKYIS